MDGAVGIHRRRQLGVAQAMGVQKEAIVQNYIDLSAQELLGNIPNQGAARTNAAHMLLMPDGINRVMPIGGDEPMVKAEMYAACGYF